MITQEIFDAFIRCHTKSHLIGHYLAVEGEAANLPQAHLEQAFRRYASDRLRATVAEGQLYVGTPPVRAIKQRTYSLIADCCLSTTTLKAELHGLRLSRGAGRADRSYTPIRFLSNEKLSVTDRLLLAFDAFVFSQFAGIRPHFGEFVHGQDCRTTRIPLAALYDKVESVLTAISAATGAVIAPTPRTQQALRRMSVYAALQPAYQGRGRPESPVKNEREGT